MKNIEELSESIKDEFFGSLAAYPIGNGKYQLESGERRYHALLKAGYKEATVEITEPPKTMIERRYRLLRRNLHGRAGKETPMDIARVVKFTYDTHCMKKEEGLEDGSVTDLTARDLEISPSQVYKYKALLSLIPELQGLLEQIDENDKPKYSWAILSSAVVLPPENQLSLYQSIQLESKLHPITGEWLKKEIEEHKHFRLTPSDKKYHYDRSDVSMYSEDLQKKLTSPRGLKKEGKRERRIDGAKAINKSAQLLYSALSDQALIKPTYEKDVYNKLMEMQASIKDALHSYQMYGKFN